MHIDAQKSSKHIIKLYCYYAARYHLPFYILSLRSYFLHNYDCHDYAVEEAGKAAGRLLKEVLINDKRTFESEERFTRRYRWTGAEAN